MSFAAPRLRERFEQVHRLRQTGQTAMADMVAREILAAPAAGPDDYYCQALLLMDLNRFTEARARFDLALSRGVPTPELLVDRAVALIEGKRFADAIASCETALKLKPGFAPAFLIQGDAWRELGKPEEALQAYDQAARAQRDFVPAFRNRADLNMARKDYAAALEDFNRLVRLLPEDAVLHNARGQVLGELERFEEALRSFDRALALNPRYAGALHNRGVTLWNMERYEEAVAAYDQALALAPNPVTQSNKANTLQELMRLDDAMSAHDRAVAMQPNHPSSHWNRAQGKLLQGRWREGLEEFEWRKQRPEGRADYLSVPQPEWLGDGDLAGRTLLIRAEQGLGDTLHFIRYAALAQERGARVVLAVQKPLVRLLREYLVPPADAVIGKDDPLPAFDLHVPAMSLAFAFRSEVESAPARVPYLKADSARIAQWRETLGDGGFKIGIAWRGAGGVKDRGRAYPLRLLAGIAALPGVRLISLQKGVGVEELETLPPGMKVETLGADFDSGPDAFLDTIAVMESLDLVISSDTSIAHLAGALARPTWLATKFVPEWRWLLHREDSVWYPTIRLFRQARVGDWSAVFAAMEKELAETLQSKA
jgi:tetratricopeptide (TPR) repeat protein